MNSASGNEARQFCYFMLIAALCLLASTASHAQAGSTGGASISLNDFISQVKQGNSGTRGALESSEGQKARANEGELLLLPTAFATAQYSHDGKPQLVAITSYDFQDIWQYSLGISQKTTFGLEAKLSSNLYALSYTGATSFFSIFANDTYDPFLRGLANSGGFPGSVNVTNQLELTQSLWGNGFGTSTRANQTLIESQALAQSYGNRFAARNSLVEAEGAYWHLLTSRQSVELTHENLERAQKNYDWNVRRAKLQLTDQGDALQSQALLELRKLDYQRALDEERTASRAFNTARGVASDQVPEQLPAIGPEMILAMTAPKRVDFRDDVKAAAEQSRAAVAGSEISRERDKPTLDIFGIIGLNGQDYGSTGGAYHQALSMVHPTGTVGLRFQSPIAFILAPKMREAYTREEAGADLTYQRKVFEQEQLWKDLTDRLDQAKRRLQLAVALEKAQANKLFHERERYRTGRTTAFQVTSFETDYAQSELGRIGSETEVLGLLTQMKLYGEEL